MGPKKHPERTTVVNEETGEEGTGKDKGTSKERKGRGEKLFYVAEDSVRSMAVWRG